MADIDDPKKKALSTKCKRAADERMSKVGFSHRFGRGGYKAIVERFEDEFGRPPTSVEIEYAQTHAYEGMAKKTKKELRQPKSCKVVLTSDEVSADSYSGSGEFDEDEYGSDSEESDSGSNSDGTGEESPK
ncbi:hypothetical protein M758_UG220400 [Ceratodon purpureus]|nr:hypothetical protein M758_UG220400 [Ceratodon purpureus]